MSINKDCFKYLTILNLFYLIVLYVINVNYRGSSLDIFIFHPEVVINILNLIFLIGIILLFWFSYKYFSKSSYTRKIYKQRRNKKIMLNHNINNYLIISLISLIGLVFISEYIREISVITQYFDIPIFIIATVLIAKGTWILMKKIDRINLESDLNCWGLRILGFIIIVFGLITIIVIPFSSIIASYELEVEIPYFYTSIPAILGLAMIIVGAFTEFRSFRRYGYFVYMR